MVVTCTEAPQAVSPSPTSSFKTSLEVAVFYLVLTTLPSFVEAELVLAGLGATLSSPEERNTVAARMCQVLPLVKRGMATHLRQNSFRYMTTIDAYFFLSCISTFISRNNALFPNNYYLQVPILFWCPTHFCGLQSVKPVERYRNIESFSQAISSNLDSIINLAESYLLFRLYDYGQF